MQRGEGGGIEGKGVGIERGRIASSTLARRFAKTGKGKREETGGMTKRHVKEGEKEMKKDRISKGRRFIWGDRILPCERRGKGSKSRR